MEEPTGQDETENGNESGHDRTMLRHAGHHRVPTALIAWSAIIVVAIVALALIGLKLLSSPIVINPNPFPAASSSTLHELSTEAFSTLSNTGAYDTTGLAMPVLIRSANNGSSRVPGSSSRGNSTPRGNPVSQLPVVTFVGSEYCPYCEAASWPLVLALSRFGTFRKLGIAGSSSAEVFPSISGFSFYRLAYTSKYVDFTGVEEASSTPSSNPYNGFTTMNSPSESLSSLLQRYDKPPYVAQTDAGALPFLDISNQVIVAGPMFPAGLLQAKSYSTITNDIAGPSKSIAGQAIITSANLITASICAVTGTKPAVVCSSPAIHQATALLAADS
ncbi:MAG: DUF929 domain-containing protein [Actinobacteria bacterium]|jgi:hypothetical protein|nr:DUF929 domain-containing protein [Actinomycetota bacterium]